MSWGPRCPGLLRIILLILVVRPAAAHFAAAEAAEQRGDLATAYQACKTDAEAGDARCQNYLGVMSKTRPPRGAGRRRGGASLPPRRRAGPCRSAIQSGTCVCSGPRGSQEPGGGIPLVSDGGRGRRSRGAKRSRHSRRDGPGRSARSRGGARSVSARRDKRLCARPAQSRSGVRRWPSDAARSAARLHLVQHRRSLGAGSDFAGQGSTGSRPAHAENLSP